MPFSSLYIHTGTYERNIGRKAAEEKGSGSRDYSSSIKMKTNPRKRKRLTVKHATNAIKNFTLTNAPVATTSSMTVSVRILPLTQ